MAWRVAALALWGLIACGSKDPVRELVRDLDRYPEYSLIVDDTRIEGSFFPDYALRFQVLTAAGQRVAGRDTIVYKERRTDWMEVREETFYRYEKVRRHGRGLQVARWPPHRYQSSAPARLPIRRQSPLRVLGRRWVLAILRSVRADARLNGGWLAGWARRLGRLPPQPGKGSPVLRAGERRPAHFWVTRLADPKDAAAILPAPAKPPPGL